MGFLRFFLALCVIFSHAGSGIVLAVGHNIKIPMFGIGGREAVGIFYIISGFYMAMIITEKYGNSLRHFYASRFLRIFPTYWTALILGIIFIRSDFASIFHGIQNTGFVSRLYYYFCNLFIIGSDGAYLLSANGEGLHWNPFTLSEVHNGSQLLFDPPVFTVGIELLFYAICPLIIKSMRNTLIVISLGFAYHFLIILTQQVNIVYQYHVFPSSLLYFSLGILSYKIYAWKEYKLEGIHYVFFLLFLIMAIFIQPLLPNLLLIFFPVVVPVLFHLTKKNKIDRFLGDLSYPLYIVHYLVLKYMWTKGIAPVKLGLYTALISLVLAVLIHLIIERPMDKLRHKLLT